MLIMSTREKSIVEYYLSVFDKVKNQLYKCTTWCEMWNAGWREDLTVRVIFLSIKTIRITAEVH